MPAPQITPPQIKRTNSALSRTKAGPADMDFNADERKGLAKLAGNANQPAKLASLIEPLVATSMHNLLYDVWGQEAESALSTAQMPEDEVSSGYAWLVLAGNLIWAGTCLCDPLQALVIRVMSFSGATAGSGIFTPGKTPGADGRDMAGDAIANAKDNFDKQLTPLSKQAAQKIAPLLPEAFKLLPDTDAERYRGIESYTWTFLFPRLDYARKNLAVRAEMKKNIAEALNKIKAAWEVWAKAAMKWAVASGGYSLGELLKQAEIYAAYEKAGHPFRPDIGKGLTP